MRERAARKLSHEPVRRIWLSICDHYEPCWKKATLEVATERVRVWEEQWPRIADLAPRDSAGNRPRYTFFFPQEEYRPEFLEPLARMTEQGVADVEVHIHHDGEGREDFRARMSGFCRVLHEQHGLLRSIDGQIRFGFIHGNWCLDNSRPDGRWCGLNDEITLLRDLGCYADFTMPAGSHPAQARTMNVIYTCTDDPNRPKSYDTGVPVRPGTGIGGDLLMVPGPFGLRWRERLLPRMETGEIAANDLPSAYRVKRWFELAPQIGGDLFVKLYTHGAQERNSSALLSGALKDLFEMVKAEAGRRQAQVFFVSAWQMYRAIEALAHSHDPVEYALRDAGTLSEKAVKVE